MSNLCQPQGVTLTLSASQSAFARAEFVEDGQITLPNLINLKGTGNSGTFDLIINDGLLRTHQDSMIIAVDNTGGSDLSLGLLIAKTPITDLSSAKAQPATHFVTSFALTIKADEKRHLQLSLINGQYVLADRALDLAAV